MFSSALANTVVRSGAYRTYTCDTAKLIFGKEDALGNYKDKKIVDHFVIDGIHKLTDTNTGLQWFISTRIVLPPASRIFTVFRPLPLFPNIAQFQINSLAPSPRLHVALVKIPSDNVYIDTTAASETMPTTTEVVCAVLNEAQEVLEIVPTSSSDKVYIDVAEEEQEAAEAVPAASAASAASPSFALKNSAEKTVSWSDPIVVVKEYEVELEEKCYKQSLMDAMSFESLEARIKEARGQESLEAEAEEAAGEEIEIAETFQGPAIVPDQLLVDFSKMAKISMFGAMVGIFEIFPAPKVFASVAPPNFWTNVPTSSSNKVYIDINTASEATPAKEVAHAVDNEVQEVLNEIVLALELFEEEAQEAKAVPSASTSSTFENSAKKAVRWDDQIEVVKEYEVTVEERRYKRSLLKFINSKGPAPWSSPSHHPQRCDAQVMMPCCCS